MTHSTYSEIPLEGNTTRLLLFVCFVFCHDLYYHLITKISSLKNTAKQRGLLMYFQIYRCVSLFICTLNINVMCIMPLTLVNLTMSSGVLTDGIVNYYTFISILTSIAIIIMTCQIGNFHLKVGFVFFLLLLFCLFVCLFVFPFSFLLLFFFYQNVQKYHYRFGLHIHKIYMYSD